MDKRQADVIKIAKGISIFCVVLGHTMIPAMRENDSFIYRLWTIIYLFHMPVFFAASGILYELNRNRYEKESLQFIKRKWNLLIIPYLTISVCIYLLLMAANRIPGVSGLMARYIPHVPTLKNALLEVLTYENHMGQHLWFVLVLFLIFLTNILTCRLNQRILCIGLMIAPVFVLPVLKAKYAVPDIPNYFLFELPFFMLGRLIAQEKPLLNKATKENITPFVFAALAFLYLAFINETDILPGPVRWVYLFVTRCAGIMMVFSLAAFIEKKNFLKTLWKYLERKSYPIYLLHQPFMVSGTAGVLIAMGVPNPIVIGAGTLAGLAVPLMIDQVMGKNRLYQKWILGGRIER